MLTFILKYPVLLGIAIIAVFILLAWASSGGLETFHNSAIDTVGEATGVNNIADKIRNPFG